MSVNDKITVENLLYGLMLVSGNDAAVALSEFIGNSVEGFANMMNQKAANLGLISTHFVTPHGLDQDEHYTTAHELAKIADYALQNETFAKIVKTSNYTVTIDGNSKSLHNTNELLGYLDGVYGVKTGFTNGAGRCLVTSTTRNGHRIICVVLGADTKKIRTTDSVKLIEYAFANYEYINVKEKIQEKFNEWLSQKAPNIQYNKAKNTKIEYCLEENGIKWVPVLKEEIKDIEVKVSYETQMEAPLQKDHIVGKVEIMLKEEVYLSLNIMLKEDIQKKQITDYLTDFCNNYCGYLLSNMESL